MPTGGLLALLDDVAALTKKTAVLADDVASLSALSAKKASGILGDDLALNAQQLVGIDPKREIPIVLAVAKGSLRNKGLILLPGALLLSWIAPWSITPILMAGGAFLCFEGMEKLLHGSDHADEGPALPAAEAEQAQIAGAIRTDLILSGEIMALTLATVADRPMAQKALVLATVGLFLTVAVYGLVALLVKLDDIGLHLMEKERSRALGRFIVHATPKLLRVISIVGTAAIFVVGGGILVHGTPPLHHTIEHLIEAWPARGLFMIAAEAAVGLVAGLLCVGGYTAWTKVRAR